MKDFLELCLSYGAIDIKGKTWFVLSEIQVFVQE
jgi:hypothetical protein